MKSIKWFRLLNKRLYKKPVFLMILALIPLLVLLLGVVSRQQSGFVNVALYAPDRDPVTAAVFRDLKANSRLVAFTEYDSAAEARRQVKNGGADAAWIFPAELQQKIAEIATTDSAFSPIITVIEREQTIPLRLSHEKLTSALYKWCAKPLYIDFVRTELSAFSAGDQELEAYYNTFENQGELFAFETAGGGEELMEAGYLMAPVRGLLSVVLLLCGIAAALFYMQDEKRGTFSWVPDAKKPLVLFGCLMIAVLNVAAVMLISLYIAGLGVFLLREMLILLLYAISCSVFCMLLQQLTGNLRVLCALIPFLAVVTIAVCPVFFDLKALGPAQLLLPATYYLRSVYRNEYMGYTLLYTIVVTALYLAARKIRRKKNDF